MRLIPAFILTLSLIACSAEDIKSPSRAGEASTSNAEESLAISKSNDPGSIHKQTRSTRLRFGTEPLEIIEMYSSGSSFHNIKFLQMVKQYRNMPNVSVVRLPSAGSSNEHQFALVFLAAVESGAQDSHLICLYENGFTSNAILNSGPSLNKIMAQCGLNANIFQRNLQSPAINAKAYRARAFTRELNPVSAPGVLVAGKTYLTLDYPAGLDQGISTILSK